MDAAQAKLKALCNLKVTDAVLSLGDAGLSFENGTSLAIYNAFELVGLDVEDTKKLVGQIITDVVESQERVTIRFSNTTVLHVDMRDGAYHGPEAMQLRVPGEPIVVWS